MGGCNKLLGRRKMSRIKKELLSRIAMNPKCNLEVLKRAKSNIPLLLLFDGEARLFGIVFTSEN